MLTRMGASSTARARISPSMAALMLAPRAQPARGRLAAIPDVNTIEPPSRIFRLPYLAARNACGNVPRSAMSRDLLCEVKFAKNVFLNLAGCGLRKLVDEPPDTRDL